MDLAQELIRSVARAFYAPEYILIIDAVLLHSALRDDDLAYLMGSQTKHTRKLCSRLREDGLLNVQSQQEIKQGANKATSRDYYYINYHRAIDIIKYRLKCMTREIERKFGQSEEEKKDYVCERCKSEWTQMDVLDTLGPDGDFVCKRCGSSLRHIDTADQNSAGHEMQSRLNNQLAPFEKLMRQIDEAEVPENDFETAKANHRPVPRDQNLNPGVRSEVVNGRNGMPASTVHGQRTEAEKVQVRIHDAAQAAKQEAEEAEKKARLAEQNALPAWHTTSTVTGQQTELGMKEDAMRREREANGALAFNAAKDQVEEDQKIEPLQDNSQLDAYFAAVREDEAKRNLEEMDDDDEDDDDDDDDDDEDDDEADFEDVAMDNVEPSAKRSKVEEPVSSGSANGVGAGISDASAEPSTSGSLSASAVKSRGGAAGATDGAASADASPEASDEDEFEDAM